MKLPSIIEELAEMTPQQAQSQTREEAIKNMGKWGKKLTMSLLPTGLLLFAASPKVRAGSASTQDVGSVLNFALTLEYLESSFYRQGVAASGLITAADLPIFQQILKHEDAHVTLLISALNSISVTPVATPNFDFTGGQSSAHTGPYHAFTDYPTFMALSQGFEDTGVRAYKGQAGNLQVSPSTLQTALQIHSVEARHAAEVRRLRGEKGWITGTSNTLPSGFASIYAGEDNLSQGGVNDVTTITTVGANAMTEGFDEPLDMNAVLAIAGLFIYP